MTKRQPQPRESTVRVVSVQMYDGTPVSSPEAQGRIARAPLGDPATEPTTLPVIATRVDPVGKRQLVQLVAKATTPKPSNTAQKSA